MNRRALFALGVAALAAVLAAGWLLTRGESEAATDRVCPPAWRAGWQDVARRVNAPVYCPRWISSPLTGEVEGPYGDVTSIDERGRSYLVSFIYKEREDEVHVNFRGYVGRTGIPRCIDTYTVAGVTRRKRLPCFGDPGERKQIGGLDFTVFNVNRDADQWHVLYAWERDGSLYTLSQHVGFSYGRPQVVASLDRMMRGLALVEPSGA